MNKIIAKMSQNWRWAAAFGPIVIMALIIKGPLCVGYTHPFAKGIINQVVRYKGMTRIVLQNEWFGNYGYFIKNDMGDSLTRYARKGDRFERVKDSIKIVRDQHITMWALDTTYWRCTCYPWQRD